jgi:hypothetical protein
METSLYVERPRARKSVGKTLNQQVVGSSPTGGNSLLRLQLRRLTLSSYLRAPDYLSAGRSPWLARLAQSVRIFWRRVPVISVGQFGQQVYREIQLGPIGDYCPDSLN